MDFNFRIASIDKPDKLDQLDKLDKLDKSRKFDKADKVSSSRKSDSLEPLSGSEKALPEDFLDALDQVDPDLTEQLALEAGAVLTPFQFVPTMTSLLNPLQEEAPAIQQAPLPVESAPVEVSTMPVFFQIPQTAVSLPTMELPKDTATSVTPTAFPEWLAAEVKRIQQAGASPLTQLTVQLDPPNLGKMQLTVSMMERQVSVEIAALPQAKPLIEPSLGQIRAILTSMNLSAGEIKIAAQPKSGFQREGEYPQQNRWARKRTSENDSLSVT